VQTPQNQIVPAQPDAGAVQSQPLNDNQPLSSNPVAQAQAPGPKGTWRSVLIGALQGLATGGVVGAARQAEATAASGKTPIERGRDAYQQQQQEVASTIRFKDAQAAEAVAHATIYNHAVEQLPQEDQQAIEEHNQKLATFLYGLGYNPTLTVAHNEPNSGVAGLQHLQSINGGEVPNTITLHVGDGATLVFTPPAPGQPNAGAQQLEALNALQRTAGLPETPSGMWSQMKGEDQFKLFSSALETNRAEARPEMLPGAVARDQGILKQLQQVRPWDKSAINQVQERLDIEQQTQKSQQAEFNRQQQIKAQYQQQVADARARRADQLKQEAATMWRPGVTADEKKKADLSENLASNAGDVASILLRRPDLVGAVSGRFTNVEQMIGNNDPDISAIGVHVHNMAMANSGIHGFRSQEGVKSYEQGILNNFKNGPQAIAGALRASVSSVQTFVDAARPDTYRTHSKQGGVLRGMRSR
jgi:hypothetical protein